MSAHTPEPWEFWNRTTDDPDSKLIMKAYPSGEKGAAVCAPIAEMGSPKDADFDDDANGERIVACVNALAGINPEAVPMLVKAARLKTDRHVSDRRGDPCRCGLCKALAACEVKP